MLERAVSKCFFVLKLRVSFSVVKPGLLIWIIRKLKSDKVSNVLCYDMISWIWIINKNLYPRHLFLFSNSFNIVVIDFFLFVNCHLIWKPRILPCTVQCIIWSRVEELNLISANFSSTLNFLSIIPPASQAKYLRLSSLASLLTYFAQTKDLN